MESKVSYINDKVLRNKHLTTEAIARISKSKIIPILTHTAEIRVDTTRIQSLLETAKIRIVRKVTNKTLTDRMTSQEIRKICFIICYQWT